MRRTRISFSRLRVWAISYADCIRIRVSIFTPNAFSIRKAISPDRPALLLSRLDRAGRETLSAFAVSVTERPAGSTISVRIKSPGWGGFLIGMVSSNPQDGECFHGNFTIPRASLFHLV